MTTTHTVGLKALPGAGPPEFFFCNNGLKPYSFRPQPQNTAGPVSFSALHQHQWSMGYSNDFWLDDPSPKKNTSDAATDASISIPIGVESSPTPPEKRKINYFVVMMCLWIILNGVAVVCIGMTKKWTTESCTFALALGNLCASVVTRNEHFSNAVMWSMVRLTRRETLHRLAHNVGGIHAGAGTCCTGWSLASVVSGIVSKQFSFMSVEFFLRSSSFLCLVITAVLAMKFFRRTHHNAFEYIHRALPWVIGILFLLDSILSNRSEVARIAFISQCCVVFVSLLTSAMTILKLDATVSLISESNKKMGVIELPAIPYPGPGKIIKLSTDLKEWHTFAICPNIYGRHGSMCLVASAGDWTESLLKKCENGQIRTTFYTKKGIPSYMYSSRAFSSVACIGTGAGIAPSLALFGQSHVRKLVWINNMSQSVEPITKYASSSGTQFKIFDTSDKRPAVKEIMSEIPNDVEAVFVMANPKITSDIKEYCNEMNIVCFGSNWDH
eukprot:TRINITY_DN121_c1_g1_i10.p1 TRINITY_DN121_c1_g1~~TRINITY_DN121_c1_g1_i10.p1  ORF type:complete len:498 (+),score=63.81 TRINITY_DN121_c1_g1_i10:53-1546(+)